MKYLLSIVAIIIVLSSCTKIKSKALGDGKQDRCRAFDPEYISSWMPYELNNIYKYIDSSGKKFTLTVNSHFSSEEYWAPSRSCSTSGGIYAFTRTVDSMDIKMTVTSRGYYPDPFSPHVDISWMDANVRFQRFYSDTLQPEGLSLAGFLIKDKMAFGGKEYNTVHELLVNTEMLQKLYIVKGIGVVAFITADSSTFWLSN